MEKKEKDGLPPLNTRFLGSDTSNRPSVISSSSSFVSLADSKYARGTVSSIRGFIPYACDPSGDENEPIDEEDCYTTHGRTWSTKQEVRPS